jgi:hypothetical protein
MGYRSILQGRRYLGICVFVVDLRTLAFGEWRIRALSRAVVDKMFSVFQVDLRLRCCRMGDTDIDITKNTYLFHIFYSFCLSGF